MPNKLIHQSSPYLLQHANNPVNWYPWGDEALNIAKKENKLILISIGYSACHWCHVMEHESFEDEAVATIMNQNFINIKVDREERPDIDMVYMGAVQLMTGQGGWPLNCFALPDGRPIYGGTYFPRNQWLAILQNLADLYQTNPDKAVDYANQLTNGLEKLELPKESEHNTFNFDSLRKSVNRWKPSFDKDWGGPNRAPKFPLPNNYLFLIKYSDLEDDPHIHRHIDLTLTKMAYGGIYDHLGGGFSRYSTDVYWKVPHFEKMLYDNAQLISLYSEAYRRNPKLLYKKVVYETIEFIKEELTRKDFGFYSALDADSEGVEGKYYVWQQHELIQILKDEYAIFAEYYSVNEVGYWEDDNYVLMRDVDEVTIALKYNISVQELQEKMSNCKRRLLQVRQKRIKPGLDNKVLASWNGLLCKALIDAYLIFNDVDLKQLALQNAHFLKNNFCETDGKLIRTKSNETEIAGFLDDYAFVADAFISVYVATADEGWLLLAKKIVDYSLQHFYDSEKNTFFYTSDTEEKLIVRKAEWSDNVIPSSSSQMAINLFKLSVYFENQNYYQVSGRLLKAVIGDIESYGPGYSNWALLLCYFLQPLVEVVIVGKSVNEKLIELYKHTASNMIFVVSEGQSDLPLVKNRHVNHKTMIYVCKQKTCQLPTEQVKEALQHIESIKI